MSTGVRTIVLVVATAIVLTSGVWLTRAGRSYGAALLNVHKLVDLAAVVVIGIEVYQANRAMPFAPTEWLVIGAATFLVVITFASGGILSGMQTPPVAALWLHRVGSWVTTALAGASFYVVVTR